MWSGRKYFWSASSFQNIAHQALPLIQVEYKACRSNILFRARGDRLKEKVKPRDNFHKNRGATSKFQLKPLYSCLNPSHMPCHTVSSTLLHTCSISPLFLPLDSCISITGHPILFFHTLFMECLMNEYLKVLWASGWLCDPTKFVTQVLPNLNFCFDSLFETVTQFSTGVHALTAPLPFPGQISPFLLVTDTQKRFWNLPLCK